MVGHCEIHESVWQGDLSVIAVPVLLSHDADQSRKGAGGKAHDPAMRTRPDRMFGRSYLAVHCGGEEAAARIVRLGSVQHKCRELIELLDGADSINEGEDLLRMLAHKAVIGEGGRATQIRGICR